MTSLRLMRGIFLLEMRRVLAPSLVLGLAGFAVVYGIELSLERGRGVARAEAVVAGNLTLLAFLGVLALAAGARSFAAEMRGRQVHLLHSLPVGRGASFAAVALAGLASLMVTILALLLIRPSLFASMRQGVSGLFSLSIVQLSDDLEPAGAALSVLSAAMLLLLLFAAGVWSALLLRRPLAAYLTAAALLAGMLHEMWTITVPVGPDLACWLAWSALASLGLLGLGWRFFRDGELDLARSKLRNVSLSLGLLFALPWIGWLVHHRTSVHLPEPWSGSLRGVTEMDVGLSGGAEWVGPTHLAVLERLPTHRHFGRLSVVEIASGEITGRKRLNRTQPIGWTPGGESLLAVENRETWLTGVVRRNLLLPELHGFLEYQRALSPHISPRLLRLGPAGEVLATYPLGRGEIVAGAVVSSTEAILARRDDRRTAILRVDLATGDVSAILDEPSPDVFRFAPVGEEVLVGFREIGARERFWRIGSGITELEDARSRRFGLPCVSEGRVYRREQLRDLVLDRHGVPGRRESEPHPDGELHWRVWEPVFLDDLRWVFYSEPGPEEGTRRLWVLDRSASQWRLLTGDAAADERIRADPGSGLAVSVARDRTVRLHDAAVGEPMPLSPIPEGDLTFWGPTIYPVAGGREVVLGISLRRPADAEPLFARLYRYLPGSGEPRELPWEEDLYFDAQIVQLDGTGERLLVASGGRFVVHGRSGEARQIWPPD